MWSWVVLSFHWCLLPLVFCAMWVLNTGAQQGKTMESRINPFSITVRYVPHTWAVCMGTGKQRAAVFCSTPGPGIISKTSSMPVWVARDSNHKVRGVQQNRERPLRRDRVREEELEKERKRDDVKATCAQGLLFSSLACRSPAALTTIPAWGCLTTQCSQGPSLAWSLALFSFAVSLFLHSKTHKVLSKHSPAYLTGHFLLIGPGAV